MKHAVLLWGSPKPASKSASYALGLYLADRLRDRGVECEEFQATRAVKDDESRAEFVGAVGRSELLICSAPLYFDSLPGPMTRALEVIRSANLPPRNRRVTAISNSGFPEMQHNMTALRIVRLFTRECGFEWAGGLAMGMGAVISGPPLEKAGGMARNARKALELAAAALSEGGSIPDEATELMAKKLMPAWVYRAFGNRGWRQTARRHGVEDDLLKRPYEHEG